MISLLTLLTAAAATESPEPQAVLGKFIHTHGSVHSLNRSALEEELRERGTRWLPTDNDDTLRLRIFDARNRLLDHRNRHVMHAEQVMIEAQQHSTTNLFADANLETLLADDNAIFSDTLESMAVSVPEDRAVRWLSLQTSYPRSSVFRPLRSVKKCLRPFESPRFKFQLSSEI